MRKRINALRNRKKFPITFDDDLCVGLSLQGDPGPRGLVGVNGADGPYGFNGQMVSASIYVSLFASLLFCIVLVWFVFVVLLVVVFSMF